MKKTALIIFVLFFNILNAQSFWQTEMELDEFGDPTGNEIKVLQGKGEWFNQSENGIFEYTLKKDRSDQIELYIFLDAQKVVFHKGQSPEGKQDLLGAMNDISFGAITVKYPDGQKQTLTGQAMYLWDPTVFIPVNGKMRKTARKSPNQNIEIAVQSKFFDAGTETYVLSIPLDWD